MPSLPVSPLAPKRFARIPPIPGVRLSAARAGERYAGRTDVVLAALDPASTVAGVLTRSAMPGAPVSWCRRHLGSGKARAIIVNAGNANVFSGAAGDVAVAETAAAVANALGCRSREVLVASTGVIGEPLRHARIVTAVPKLVRGLSDTAWRRAAEGIRTTDTFAKGASRTARIGGATVSLAGIAKGSGMIAPDMATMLAFLFTDARIPAPVLRQLLRQANAKTFNRITVDSDTSTSDTVLLCATGKARRQPRIARAGDPLLADFKTALHSLMLELAHQVVRDGEGARKFIAITVSGAASSAAARRIGLSIANSPLVKTAIAGEDANWGRIVMAIGKAGERADRDALEIRIGEVLVAQGGIVHPGYDEAAVLPHMRASEIEIAVDVGVGRGHATVWTCDLTHGYIDINADYRS